MNEATILLEYVLKNLQLISEGIRFLILFIYFDNFKGNTSINAALMLKLHAKIVEKKGYGIQIRAISKKNPL